MNREIIRIVDKCKTGVVNHMKNIKLLVKVYKQSDYEEFQDAFKRLVLGVIHIDFENPQTKCILEFLGKFLAFLASHDQSVEKESEDSNSASEQPMRHPLLKNICGEVIKYHNSPSLECRYNTCVFLSVVLQNMGHNVIIEEDISGTIMSAMLENVQDPKPEIRAQAMWALARLQDPMDKQCPAIAAFMNCLKDSKAKIRKEAVKKIAPNKTSNAKLQERLRDKDAGVRVAAFNHVANIGIRRFKIIERQKILRNGFGEENSQVKKVFLEYLLPKWLTTMNGSYLDLLQAIRLDADEQDLQRSETLCSKIMDQFFKTESIDALIKALPLDENKVIPEDLVKTELVQYWNIIVKYLRQSEDLDEHLERVIPSLSIFCVYIDTVITTKYTRAVEEWQKLDQQYLLYQLFSMAEDYDLSDEMGRKSLNTLILKVLKKYRFQPRLMIKLIEIARKMAMNADVFADEICNIVLDIWQPITEHVTTQPVANVRDGAREFEINKNKVQLIQWSLEMEDAIQKQKFILANEIKDKIFDLKKKMEKPVEPELPPPSQVTQTKTPTDDPEKLCWCLDMLAALLGYGGIENMTQFLINCREELVISTISKDNTEISNRSFKCFMLYAIYDQEFARKHVKVISAPIARYSVECSKAILLDSIKVLSDLIRIYGTNLFISETDSIDSTVRTKRLYQRDDDDLDLDKTYLTVDEVIDAFLDMLDDQDEDIRNTSVLTLGKLVCNGFPVNTTTLTKLILKYFDPSSQKNLQQYLGMIIGFYCQNVQESRSLITKAIIPILTSVAEASREDSIADIEIDNIIKFLVTMTDAVSKDEMGTHLHVPVGKIVIDELALRPTEMVSGYLSKVLIHLRVPVEDPAHVQIMIRISETILNKNTLTKMVANNLKKLLAKLRGQHLDATENTNSTMNTTGHTTNTTNNEQPAAKRLSTLPEEDDDFEKGDRNVEDSNRVPTPKPNGLTRADTAKRKSNSLIDEVPIATVQNDNLKTNNRNTQSNNSDRSRPTRNIKPNGRYEKSIYLSPKTKKQKTAKNDSSEEERVGDKENTKVTSSSISDDSDIIGSSQTPATLKKKHLISRTVSTRQQTNKESPSARRVSLRKANGSIDLNRNMTRDNNKRTLPRSPSQSTSPRPKHFKTLRQSDKSQSQRFSQRQQKSSSTSKEDSQSSQDTPDVRVRKTKLKTSDERNSLRRIPTSTSTESDNSPVTRRNGLNSSLRSRTILSSSESEERRSPKIIPMNVKITPLKDVNRSQATVRTSPRSRSAPARPAVKNGAKENNVLHSRVEVLRSKRAVTRSSTSVSETTSSDGSFSEPINSARSRLNSSSRIPEKKGPTVSTKKRNKKYSPFRRSKREIKKPRLGDFV